MEPNKPQLRMWNPPLHYKDVESPVPGTQVDPASGRTYQTVSRERLFDKDTTDFLPHSDEVHIEGHPAVKSGKAAKQFIGDINKQVRLRREAKEK